MPFAFIGDVIEDGIAEKQINYNRISRENTKGPLIGPIDEVAQREHEIRSQRTVRALAASLGGGFAAPAGYVVTYALTQDAEQATLSAERGALVDVATVFAGLKSGRSGRGGAPVRPGGSPAALADAEAGGASRVGVPVVRLSDPIAPVREFDAYGNEIYYRTMSRQDASFALANQKVPSTPETSLTTTPTYADLYSGVVQRITVQRGTSVELQKTGIAANEPTSVQFPNLSQTGGFGDAARFKIETRKNTPKTKLIYGPTLSTQLGRGKALDLFNSRIIKIETVRGYVDRRANPILTREQVRELEVGRRYPE